MSSGLLIRSRSEYSQYNLTLLTYTRIRYRYRVETILDLSDTVLYTLVCMKQCYDLIASPHWSNLHSSYFSCVFIRLSSTPSLRCSSRFSVSCKRRATSTSSPSSMMLALARLLLTWTVVWTSAVSSHPVSTSSSRTSKTSPTASYPPVSSVSSSWPPTRALWTTKRPVERLSAARFSVSSTERMLTP